MKKWFILGSVTAAAMLAVSVYAFQGKASSRNQAPEGSTEFQAAGCSGCVTTSGCGSVSGACGRTSSSREDVQSRLRKIEAYFVDYYTDKQGLEDITVEVKNFGCHEEATIRQAGQVIARFSITGESISPLEG